MAFLSPTRCITALVALLVSGPVAAQSVSTVEKHLDDVIAHDAVKCQTRGAFEKSLMEDKRMAEATADQLQMARQLARIVRDAEALTCDCVPAQVKSLRASLSRQVLDRRMTEVQFREEYAARIAEPCEVKFFRASYREGCSEEFAGRVKDSVAYCACMLKELTALPDADLVKIAREPAIQRFPDTRPRRQPQQELPPAAQRFSSIDGACR